MPFERRSEHKLQLRDHSDSQNPGCYRHGRDLDLALYFTDGPRRLYGWTMRIEKVEQLGTPSNGLHPSKGVLLV